MSHFKRLATIASPDVFFVNSAVQNPSGKYFQTDPLPKILLAASKLAIRWEAKESKYTFRDGTSLVPTDPNRYFFQLWTPKVPGLNVEFSVKRSSRWYVHLGVGETHDAGKPSPPRGIVRVFDVKFPQKPLCKFKVGEPDLRAGSGSYSQHSRTTVELEEGQKLRAVLTVDKKSYESPVFEP